MAHFALLKYPNSPSFIFLRSERKSFYRNCALAFAVAERELGIPALLDVEDLVQVSRFTNLLEYCKKKFKLSEKKLLSPDKFSVMTYLAQFYHKFTEQDPDSGFSSQVLPF